MRRSKKAFTLIELSIIILIISLITGGLIAGISLIKQAKLKAIISEYRNFTNAINTFRLQYNYYPGDFPNATIFWYDATSCPGTAGVAGGCNGNGDLYINNTGGTNSDESIRAWQHLSLAGLIQGNYSGVHTTANQNDIEINVPASKYNTLGWSIQNNEVQGSWLYNNGNFLYIGGFKANSNNLNPIITTSDTYNIDSKIDDGFPITGNVRGAWTDDLSANYGGNTSTTSCGKVSNNTYYLSQTGPLCIIGFKIM